MVDWSLKIITLCDTVGSCIDMELTVINLKITIALDKRYNSIKERLFNPGCSAHPSSPMISFYFSKKV